MFVISGENSLGQLQVRALSFLTMLSFIFLFSCKSTDWKRAEQKNVITEYSNFITAYPNDKLADTAREKIRLLKWNHTRQTHSIQAYQDFIQEYPDSDLAPVAKRSIDEIPWLEADKTNTMERYSFFIKNNPDNRFLSAAKEKIVSLLWKDTQRKNSVEGYEEFLEKNKNSPYKAKGTDLLAKLRLKEKERQFFENAKSIHTIHGYTTFLEIYPRSIYSDEVSALFIPLLPQDIASKVRLLIGKNPLQRGFGILNLADTNKKDLLIIVTFLINLLDDGTRINPDDERWKKSSTIGNAAKKVLVSMGEEAIPPVINALFLGGHINSKYNLKVKLQLVDTLRSIGGGKAVDALLEIATLEDSHYKVVLHALKALFLNFDDPRTENLAAGLLNGYLHDSDKNIQRDTIKILQEIKHPGTVASLVESLQENGAAFKIEVIKTLGFMGHESAVDPLITLLRAEQSAKTKGYILKALEDLGDHRAVQPILTIAKQSKDVYMRRKAARALKILFDPKKDSALLPLLTTLQKDPDEYVRQVVSELLLSVDP